MRENQLLCLQILAKTSRECEDQAFGRPFGAVKRGKLVLEVGSVSVLLHDLF